MILYTVLTCLDNDERVLGRIKYGLYNKIINKAVVILENGINGDNKHYNIVYETHQKNHYKNASKFWKQLYSQEFLDNLTTQRYLTKTKLCTSYQNVIGGYLLKETNHIILFNDGKEGGFNITECKEVAEKNLLLLDNERCKNLYDFIKNKVIALKPENLYMDANTLLNYSLKFLYNNEDLDALRYTKMYSRKLIYDITKSLLGEEIQFVNTNDI